MLLNSVKNAKACTGRYSFAGSMRSLPFFLLILISLRSFAQEKSVQGILFEKEGNERIASVLVRNITSGKSTYNSLKGEFKIDAREGDTLVFSKQNYHPDTIKILKNTNELAVYLERVSIQLREVTIRDTLLNPEKRLEATRQEYSKVYGSLAYGDFLSTAPGGGAGLSIDALWNSFSRSGRNAARLREIIQNDYQQNVIDYRFNRNYVSNITGLKDQRLTDFMFRYRPGYYTTKTASDYDFIVMIKANLRRFLRHPHVNLLPPLKAN